MTARSFNDVIKLVELPVVSIAAVRKDVTVGDVHVSTALGNEAPPKRRRKADVEAFVSPGYRVRQVVPEQRGPATNYVEPTDDDEPGHDADPTDVGKSVAFDMPIHGHHLDKRYSSTKDLPDAVKGKLKGKKRRQWMHVWNSAFDSHGDESRAFAEAWAAVKKFRKSESDTLSGEPMVGVGGRRLEPYDAGTFFIPLKYDPAALSYLRVDQVPRFLDALTHPDKLQVLPIRIVDLVAVKGRVSRETITKHLDKMAESKGAVHPLVSGVRLEGPDDLDPPVVVHMNGAFYLADGHDRTVAMWLDGVDVIEAAYQDIELYDDRKPDTDDEHRNTAYALLQGVNGRTLTNYVDGSLSVPFMVDEAFFSGLRPDQVPKFTYAVTHPDKLSDAKVALSSLVAIQNRVNIDTVARKVEKGWKKKPVIVRMNEVNYIADGHDRLTASWLRGDDEVVVSLTDITWADNSMKPSDLVKATIADRAKAQEELEQAEVYTRKVAEGVDEVQRYAAKKRAEADQAVVEAERVATEKRAEAERLAAEAERVATEKRAEADRLAVAVERDLADRKARVKKKSKLKLEVAGEHAEGMERARKRLDRYVADQQESVDLQVRKALREAESYALKVKAEADAALEKAVIARAEADRSLQKAAAEADGFFEQAQRLVKEAEASAARVRADADRYVSEKRAEAAEKLVEVNSYIESVAKASTKEQRKVLRKKAEAERYATEKQVEAERYAVEKQAEMNEALEEANRYIESVAKVSTKAQRKALKKKREAELYAAERVSGADRYAGEKVAGADEYEVAKRTAADRYEAEKQLDLEQRDLDRRRELAKYEHEHLSRMSGAAKVLKSQIASGELKLKVDITKVNQDKQLVFGWASVVTKAGVPIIDKQGDIIPVEELEPAVYEYMLTSRDASEMHVVKGVGHCIESMMFTKEKQDALGIDLGMEGWWVGYFVPSPELWSRIRSGELAEFSIGGQAISTKLD